jgi:DNA-directed RNA polymerase subunit RPC12/RpoP
MNDHICPVCNGTGRKPAGDYKYKHITSSYDAATDTLACTNCGGQRMYGRPTGKVRANKEGLPCTHKYESKTVGRCLTEYTCIHCGDRYQIDSGD